MTPRDIRKKQRANAKRKQTLRVKRDKFWENATLERIVAAYDLARAQIKFIEIELRYRRVSLETARKRIAVREKAMRERAEELGTGGPLIRSLVPLATPQKVAGWGIPDDGTG